MSLLHEGEEDGELNGLTRVVNIEGMTALTGESFVKNAIFNLIRKYETQHTGR